MAIYSGFYVKQYIVQLFWKNSPKIYTSTFCCCNLTLLKGGNRKTKCYPLYILSLLGMYKLLHNLKNLTDRLLYICTGHEIRVQTILVKGRKIDILAKVALIKYQKDRRLGRLMI